MKEHTRKRTNTTSRSSLTSTHVGSKQNHDDDHAMVPPVGTSQLGHSISRIAVNVQPKLAVNDLGDQYEQEADRVAATIVGCRPSGATIAGSNKMFAYTSASHRGQRLKPEDNAAPTVLERVLATQGQPLDMATRGFMEPRFGHAFDQIRVHTDARAAGSAQALDARAYTVGHDIVFAPDQYDPYSTEGRRLIAHELTHVAQQNGGNEGLRTTAPLVMRAPPEKKSSPKTEKPYKTVTKEDVAAIVNEHILDYRGHVYQGVNNFKPPENEESSVWFLVALGGNLVWAATSLANPLAAATIRAMSFAGATVGSGTLQKLFDEEAEVADLKPLLLADVGTYTDNLKKEMPSIVDALAETFSVEKTDDAEDSSQTALRRIVAWNYMFDNKVAPWGESSKIVTQTEEDLKLLWDRFNKLFRAIIMTVYGRTLRYKGQKLYEKTMEVYLMALVWSGIAKRSPAVKPVYHYRLDEAEGVYTVEAIEYEFPSGATVEVGTEHPYF